MSCGGYRGGSRVWLAHPPHSALFSSSMEPWGSWGRGRGRQEKEAELRTMPKIKPKHVHSKEYTGHGKKG